MSRRWGPMRHLLLPGIAVGLCALLALVLWTRADHRATPVAPAGTATAAGPGASADLRAPAARNGERRAEDAALRPAPATPGDRPPEWGLCDVEVRVVRDEDGSPLAGVEVAARSPKESPVAQVTDADGIVRWRMKGPAAWNVEATAPERTTASATIRFVPGAPTATAVLRLQTRRELRVRLVDPSGRDLSPASLSFEPAAAQAVTVALGGACSRPGGTFDPGGAPFHRVTPDSWKGSSFSWRIEIRGMEPACLHALVGDAVLATQPIALTTREVELAVDPDRFGPVTSPFTVLVTDEDGAGIAGARVRVRTPHGFALDLVAGAGGRARCERLLASEFTVAAVADGYARGDLRVHRPVADEVVLRLAPGRALRGTVVDEPGVAVANTRVAVYSTADLGRLATAIASVETDESGRFEFQGVTRQSVVLCASPRGEVSGYLPRQEHLPVTCLVVEAGGDASGLTLRRRVPSDLHGEHGEEY